MRRLKVQAAARCRQAWRQLSQSRWLKSDRLTRACVALLLVLGVLVMVDLIPRMIIIASEARETSYWESWEEAYIDKQSGDRTSPLQMTAHASGTLRKAFQGSKSAVCDCCALADFHGASALAGGLGMWIREKASMTGRRWRTAVWGRKSLKSFLHTEASCP